MTTDHEEAVRLAERFGRVLDSGYLQVTRAGLAALIADVRQQAYEESAVTAWKHYMDTCKARRIPAASNEHFCAAADIRARLEEGK
jgi:hypothetical protein